MGVAPDFGAEVNGREDGRGVYPNVMKNVGAEWGNKGKGMGVEIGDAGEVAEEVPINKLLLRDPKFLSAVVDDCVLVGVTISDKGTSGGGEEIGEDVG